MNKSPLLKYFGFLALFFCATCASRQVQSPQSKRAADMWLASCSICHGVDGSPPDVWAAKGMRRFGTLGMKMGFFFGGDKMRAGIGRTIAEGKGTEMRPFKDHLTAEEIAALVKHIESL